MVNIEENIPTVEELFARWEALLGSDYRAYKNHVYRVVNFYHLLHSGVAEEQEEIAIAGCFHDIGIWSKSTLDYLEPSIELVRAYLHEVDKDEWFEEVKLMIDFHHKITPFRSNEYLLVELFRKADWIDVTKSKRSFGLSRSEINAVINKFPNYGFHELLIKLTKRRIKRNFLNPLPMVRL